MRNHGRPDCDEAGFPASSCDMENTTNRDDLKQQIAIQAYLLWESEGCQPGRDLEYWMRAKDMVGQRQNTINRLNASEEPKQRKTTEPRRSEVGKEPARRSRKTAGALVE